MLSRRRFHPSNFPAKGFDFHAKEVAGNILEQKENEENIKNV